MKNNDEFPYLVIEKRHNDYIFFDISSLNIFANFKKETLDYNSLSMLDYLTLNFNMQEIKEAIINANVVANEKDVLNGQLIVKMGKYKLPVMTKEVVTELNLPKFLIEIFGNENNKRYLNIIYNKLSSIVKDNNLLIEIKKSIDLIDYKKFYSLISKIDYKEQRELYFYIYSEVLEKYKVSVLKRKKGAEENNE